MHAGIHRISYDKYFRGLTMAKATYQLVQLVPEENSETGTKYIIRVPTKGTKSSSKIRLRKYDPVIRQHVWFIQKKLPNPKAK
jgi:ribosomal protein L33